MKPDRTIGREIRPTTRSRRAGPKHHSSPAPTGTDRIPDLRFTGKPGTALC